MDIALKELASSGTLGAILASVFALLAIVIGVLVWMLKRYVDSSMDEKKDFSAFMTSLTTALNGLGLNFQATRTDTLSVVRDLGDRIEHVTWAAHDKMVLVFRDSLTGTANSIRKDQADLVAEMERKMLEKEAQRLREENAELSRPHDVGDGRVQR